jgi:ribose transport system substrate-binding protein
MTDRSGDRPAAQVLQPLRNRRTKEYRMKMQGRTRTAALVAVAAAAALVLAGCGSASNGASGGSGGSGDSGADYSAMMNTAREMVPATFQGPTEPAKAPAGIKIASITCYSILEGCVIPAEGVAKAAKAIGWEARTFDGGGTPTAQNTQILNAVAWGAKVIVLIAITPSAVQSGLQAAKKAGALIVSGSSGLSTPNETIKPQPGEIWPAFDVSPDYKSLGEHLAQWIIADSKGKAHVAVYGDKEFDSINAQERGIVPALKACSTCKSSNVIYFTATQIANQLGPSTVSNIRSHPDVDYIYSAFDPPAATQVQALQTAGLGRNVKIVSAVVISL